MPKLLTKTTPLLRKASRLSSMSRTEIAFRARERVSSECERWGWKTYSSELRAGADFKKYLAGGPAGRFYRGHRAGSREFVFEHFPGWVDRAIQEGDRLCRHEIELLGLGDVKLGPVIDWHRDPVTGNVWEQRFWADYRLERDSERRDPKIIHELNRHQHLPRLAKAYHWTGEERYAAEAVEQLNSWIRQNPIGRGVNWQSSLELGIRVISWLWAIFLLLPSRSLTEENAEQIGDSLFAQVDHIYRHLSIYSSPNTHLIGECVALYICGLLFGDRPRPRKWLDRAAGLLESGFQELVFSDGVYGELSSYYHCYALDFYLQALVLADQNHVAFPSAMRSGACRMVEFLMHLTRPDGTIPLMGDDDGGRALALEQKNYRSFNDAICLASVLYARSDFRHCAGKCYEETFWLLGEEGYAAYRNIASERPVETQWTTPRGGHHIQRTDWGPRAAHLVFDTGGLGILNGAHAHADALSIQLFANGRDLLLDPGTFVYNGAADWRNFFRSTRAHNTVTIDGRDQAEIADTFRWKTPVGSRMSGCRDEWIDYIEAEHDGYSRLPAGAIHRRRLLNIGGEYWIILDDFRGSGEHTFEFHYHLGPAVADPALESGDNQAVLWSAQAGLFLGLYTRQPMQAALNPAWISPLYGHKRRSAALHATVVSSLPFAAMTVLSAVADTPVVERLKLQSGSGIALACSKGKTVDIAVLSTDSGEISTGDLLLEGEFCCARIENGALAKAWAISATRMEYKNKDVLGVLSCVASAAS